MPLLPMIMCQRLGIKSRVCSLAVSTTSVLSHNRSILLSPLGTFVGVLEHGFTDLGSSIICTDESACVVFQAEVLLASLWTLGVWRGTYAMLRPFI